MTLTPAIESLVYLEILQRSIRNLPILPSFLGDDRVYEHTEKCKKDGAKDLQALRLLRVVGRIEFL